MIPASPFGPGKPGLPGRPENPGCPGGPLACSANPGSPGRPCRPGRPGRPLSPRIRPREHLVMNLWFESDGLRMWCYLWVQGSQKGHCLQGFQVLLFQQTVMEMEQKANQGDQGNLFHLQKRHHSSVQTAIMTAGFIHLFVTNCAMIDLSVPGILDHQGVHFFQGLQLLLSLPEILGNQDGPAVQGNPSAPRNRFPLTKDTVHSSAVGRKNLSLYNK